jgi:hypothetical protein
MQQIHKMPAKSSSMVNNRSYKNSKRGDQNALYLPKGVNRCSEEFHWRLLNQESSVVRGYQMLHPADNDLRVVVNEKTARLVNFSGNWDFLLFILLGRRKRRW